MNSEYQTPHPDPHKGCPLAGCKIPLARSHLKVKCYAGQVKILTISMFSTFLIYSISEKNLGQEGESLILENLHPCL